MNKLSIILITFLISSLSGLGREGVRHIQIQGLVIDKETNLPLPEVKVEVLETGVSILTDSAGTFSLTISDFIYSELKLSKRGYAPLHIPIKGESEQLLDLSLTLTPQVFELPEVFISEERLEERSLNIIRDLDLGLRPVRSSQEILRLIPGLIIAQHAGGGKAEQIFLRGFDIDHGTDISLDVDGIPVNMVSHAHGQGYADLHFLIPETIESVDFGKGPHAIEQGNFATAGYASFQTRNRIDRHSLKLELGQFNTFRGLGMINLIPENEHHHAYLAAEQMFSDGYFDASQNFRRTNLFGKYSGLLPDNSLLSFSASTFSSSWDASGQIPVRAVREGLISHFGAIDSTEGGHTSRQYINIQHTKYLTGGSRLSNQLYYSSYTFDLYSNFTFFLENPEAGDQIRQREKRQLYGYKGNLSIPLPNSNRTLISILGWGFRQDEIRDNELLQTQNRESVLERLASGDIIEINLFGYANQEWTPTERLTMNAGIRYDLFRFQYQDGLTEAYDPQTLTKGLISPKLSLAYQLNSKIRLKGSVSKGLHSNDARTILSYQSDQILPGVTGIDLEAAFKPKPGLVIQATAWVLWSEQEFVYVGDAGIVEPGGESRRLGGDVSLRYQLSRKIFADIDLNYSFARATDSPSGEDFIPLAPIWSSIGGLTFTPFRDVECSLRYRYLGDRPANENNRLIADGYTLVDVALAYKRPQFEVSLSVENLLDVEWRETQFETESRLQTEQFPVTEINYTPGSPFNARLAMSYFF